MKIMSAFKVSNCPEDLLEPVADGLAAAVLVEAVHRLEQAVVKALNPDGKPVHAHAFQGGDVRIGQMIRVGFDGYFADPERLTGQCKRVFKFVDQNGRGAAADIDALKVEPPFFIEQHFQAQGPEIIPAEGFIENDAVEGTVGAEFLAEGDVQIQKARLLLCHLRNPRCDALFEAHRPGKFLPHLARDDLINQGKPRRQRFFA